MKKAILETPFEKGRGPDKWQRKRRLTRERKEENGQAVSHAARVNLFSKLFPVKPLQKEKFKFVVKEKKESEKTPVEKDFDKIRKFQMDRRMVT